jgi:hypothetical protein
MAFDLLGLKQITTSRRTEAMPRFLLLVSFVVVSLFAFVTGTVFAGDISDKAPTKEFKQQQLKPYASLSNVIKSTQKTGSTDSKVGTKKGKASVKSSHKSSHSKKWSRSKASSKKTAYKKTRPSKASKHKSLKKTSSYSKTKAPKKTAYGSGRI